MNSLPSLYNSAANVAGFAAVYPVSPPPLSQCLPGSYGWFKNGQFTYVGNIFDDLKQARPTPWPPESTGQTSFGWNSQNMTEVQGSIGASGFIASGYSATNFSSAIQFSTKSDYMFAGYFADCNSYAMPVDVFSNDNAQLNALIRLIPNYGLLRFVSGLVTAQSYVCFGSEGKNASVTVEGEGQYLTAMQEYSAFANIAVVNSVGATFSSTGTQSQDALPVAMTLWAFSQKHHNWVQTNSGT